MSVVPAVAVAVCSLHGWLVQASVVAGPPREEDVREEIVKTAGLGGLWWKAATGELMAR